MATVKVSKKDFRIHKDLLCNVSSFFKDAFGRGNKDRDITELADIDVDLFGQFFTWVYTRHLSKGDALYREGKLWRCREHLLDLYAFAERYNVPELRVDILIHFHQTVLAMGFDQLDYTLVTEVLKRFPKKSPFRRYITDLIIPGYYEPFSVHGYLDTLEQSKLDYADAKALVDVAPRAFLVELVLNYKTMLQEQMRRGDFNRNLEDVSYAQIGSVPESMAHCKEFAETTSVNPWLNRSPDAVRFMMQHYEARGYGARFGYYV